MSMIAAPWLMVVAEPALFDAAGYRAPLDPEIERWFRAGIRRHHRASPSKPIVLFCLADCWMSWNAAKRLRSRGSPPKEH